MSLYLFPPTQGGWHKHPGAVWGSKETGTMFDPYVRRENGKFALYVSDRPNGAVIRVVSDDGVCWSGMTTLLEGVQGSDWEQEVNRACVVQKEDTWYMWYTGQTRDRSCIGMAVSRDGIHYERCSAQPVMRPEYPYEKSNVMNPCVMWDEEKAVFRMWYCAGEKCEPDVICYATSRDGIAWDKLKSPVFTPSDNLYDQQKVGGCEIVRMAENRYYLFYIGYQNIDNARICLAMSENGVDRWERHNDNPILSPEIKNWDCHAVYKPAVYYDESQNKWYLWYNGRKRFQEYIGLATNDCGRYLFHEGE